MRHVCKCGTDCGDAMLRPVFEDLQGSALCAPCSAARRRERRQAEQRADEQRAARVITLDW